MTKDTSCEGGQRNGAVHERGYGNQHNVSVDWKDIEERKM